MLRRIPQEAHRADIDRARGRDTAWHRGCTACGMTSYHGWMFQAQLPPAPRGRSRPPALIRDAREEDLGAIARIYAHHVNHGLASFEELPPTIEELRTRRAAVLDSGLPYLAAELHGEVAGYAYASTYRPRPAYRYTIEDSVYVEEGLRGRGLGRALLAALIERCERGPWRQMLAVIGDSANAGSIALHRRLGFRYVGNLESVGFKLGRWVDTVLMQRALGAGDRCRP
jgi:L-amino acid N-acyltransferase YncA